MEIIDIVKKIIIEARKYYGNYEVGKSLKINCDDTIFLKTSNGYKISIKPDKQLNESYDSYYSDKTPYENQKKGGILCIEMPQENKSDGKSTNNNPKIIEFFFEESKSSLYDGVKTTVGDIEITRLNNDRFYPSESVDSIDMIEQLEKNNPKHFEKTKKALNEAYIGLSFLFFDDEEIKTFLFNKYKLSSELGLYAEMFCVTDADINEIIRKCEEKTEYLTYERKTPETGITITNGSVIHVSDIFSNTENSRLIGIYTTITNNGYNGRIYKSFFISKKIDSGTIKKIYGSLEYDIEENTDCKKLEFLIDNVIKKISAKIVNEDGSIFEVSLCLDDNYHLELLTVKEYPFYLTINNNYYNITNCSRETQDALEFKEYTGGNAIALHPEIRGFIEMVLYRMDTELPGFRQIIEQNTFFRLLFGDEYPCDEMTEKIVDLEIPKKRFDWRIIKEEIDAIALEKTSIQERQEKLDQTLVSLNNSEYNEYTKKEIRKYIEDIKLRLSQTPIKLKTE